VASLPRCALLLPPTTSPVVAGAGGPCRPRPRPRPSLRLPDARHCLPVSVVFWRPVVPPCRPALPPLFVVPWRPLAPARAPAPGCASLPLRTTSSFCRAVAAPGPHPRARPRLCLPAAPHYLICFACPGGPWHHLAPLPPLLRCAAYILFVFLSRAGWVHLLPACRLPFVGAGTCDHGWWVHGRGQRFNGDCGRR